MPGATAMATSQSAATISKIEPASHTLQSSKTANGTLPQIAAAQGSSGDGDASQPESTDQELTAEQAEALGVVVRKKIMEKKDLAEIVRHMHSTSKKLKLSKGLSGESHEVEEGSDESLKQSEGVGD